MDLSIKSEGPRNLGFVLEDFEHMTYEVVTIVSGAGDLLPGTVLGQITTGGKYTPSPATGSDGSQTAVAVLAYAADATSADVDAVIVRRFAAVKKPKLIFHSSVNDGTKVAAKHAQLVAATIIPR